MNNIRQGLLLPLLLLLIFSVAGERPRRRCTPEAAELRKFMGSLDADQLELREGIAALHRKVDALSSVTAGIVPEDCSVAKKRGSWAPFQMIAPPGLPPRIVRCDMDTRGGGWTVALWRAPIPLPISSFHELPEEVQNNFPVMAKEPDRPNSNDLPWAMEHNPGEMDRVVVSDWEDVQRDQPSVARATLRENFNRSWADYREGFGHYTAEYWIGNEVLHALTAASAHPWQALILLSDWHGNSSAALYHEFRVGSERDGFKLHADRYHEPSSSAGDGLAFHHGRSFSTFDRDNDEYIGSHCGQDYGAGWWFYQCHVSLLTGTGQPGHGPHTLHWRNWKKVEALQTASLMIRPNPE